MAGTSPDLRKSLLDQSTRVTGVSESLPQFAGLQAIADAAISNTTDSMLDPALFSTQISLNAPDTLISKSTATPEKKAMKGPIEHHEYAEPMDVDTDLQPSPSEAVTVQERLVEDAATFTNATEDHQPASDSAKLDVLNVTGIAAVPSPPKSSVPSTAPEMEAPHPAVPESRVVQMGLPAPQTPPPQLHEMQPAGKMDIDASTQPPSPATSPLSEPPRSPAIAIASTNFEPVVSKESAALDLPSVSQELPISAESGRSSESATAPELEQSLSRASSILSDAPSDHISNEMEVRPAVATKKGKRSNARKSKASCDVAEPVDETPQAKRQSSRHSKPVERLSTQQYPEPESWSNQKPRKQASAPVANGHGPSKSRSPEVGRLKATRSKTPASTPVKTPAKSVGKKKTIKSEPVPETTVDEQGSSPTAETEEEINRRIALQIHQEGLGLRRRSRGS
jgi:hypothetical protein